MTAQFEEKRLALAQTEAELATTKQRLAQICRDLAHEQTEKADYIDQLNKQTARLEIELVLAAALRTELATVEQGFADYKVVGELFLRDLSATQGKLSDQIAETARKEAEWAAEKMRLIAAHDAQLQAAEERLAHQKRETETVSQQLISKIRQFKSERTRAEDAEARLAE